MAAMPENLSNKLAAVLLAFVIVAAYNANFAVHLAQYQLERRIEMINNRRQ